MNMECKDIIERNLNKLKGVTGLLHILSVRNEGLEILEMPYVFAYLEDSLRDMCEELTELIN